MSDQESRNPQHSDPQKPGPSNPCSRILKIMGKSSGSTATPTLWYAMHSSRFTSFDFLGATQTAAYGINSAGQIVGKYFAADGSTHGFLAEPAQKGKPQ
jgi:probable HAF family extracellular repeat protein